MKVIATCCPTGLGLPFPYLSYELVLPAEHKLHTYTSRIGICIDNAVELARAAGYDPTHEDFHVIVQFREG